ncbi:MAG: type I CRISPR-associated protein Cas8a1/Csx8 [Clostridium sp.]|nr:type I CRISPR-associated protein Cas8a1/Csx8 [Clostridium sp.]
MIETVLEENFDLKIEPSDWRFSSVISGLIEYFKFYSIDYKLDEEALYFNSEEFTNERYLEFVENKYSDDMHHKVVEGLLKKAEFTDEEIKFINEKLQANDIMKNKFKNIKFDRSNKTKIQEIIDENRFEIIENTFKNKKNLYRNYINTNCFLKDEQSSCRLLGYSVDTNKKGKSLSYNFDTSNLKTSDSKIFDMIPFAFTGDRTSYFINDNISIENIFKTNNQFKKLYKAYKEENEKNNGKNIFFYSLIEAADFITYDVEVIKKEMNKDFFESLYIRKESLDILKKFPKHLDYRALDYNIQINEDYYINVSEKVLSAVLNEALLDDLIELLIKNHKSYIAKQIIRVNWLIKKGDEEMNKDMKGAYACAKKVNETIEANKVESYKQKLLNSIIFNDKDRTCQILMQLSAYSKVNFDFAYSIFEDFDKNKEIVYTFINALGKRSSKEETNE